MNKINSTAFLCFAIAVINLCDGAVTTAPNKWNEFRALLQDDHNTLIDTFECNRWVSRRHMNTSLQIKYSKQANITVSI